MSARRLDSLFDPDAEGRGRLPPGEGIYSVCSSNPFVLEATLRRVARNRRPVLVEATANQVNQDGGYTGMTPADFASSLSVLARAAGAREEDIVFGGDHLGPWPWRKEPAARAMDEAERLVRDFVAAGARKLHLDASMPLGGDAACGDAAALEPALAVERSVRLCLAAEDAWHALRELDPSRSAPRYVIGTEVPVPGGSAGAPAAPAATAQGSFPVDGGPLPTKPQDYLSTVAAHQEAFRAAGHAEAWERVVAVVVQPGLEFDGAHVYPYRRERAAGLVAALGKTPGLVFEGHSTDYQDDGALRDLVLDGVAILKVGPALSFAMREALFGLSFIEDELLGPGKERSHLPRVAERVMREDDAWWKGYYPEGEGLSLLLRYGWSDRIRYYWKHPELEAALKLLLANLAGLRIPGALLRQFLPALADETGLERECHGSGPEIPDPKDLVLAAIDRELGRYERACMPARDDARRKG